MSSRNDALMCCIYCNLARGWTFAFCNPCLRLHTVWGARVTDEVTHGCAKAQARGQRAEGRRLLFDVPTPVGHALGALLLTAPLRARYRLAGAGVIVAATAAGV